MHVRGIQLWAFAVSGVRKPPSIVFIVLQSVGWLHAWL